MMTLKEMRDAVFASMVKKDLLYELTPENQKLFERTRDYSGCLIPDCYHAENMSKAEEQSDFTLIKIVII